MASSSSVIARAGQYGSLLLQGPALSQATSNLGSLFSSTQAPPSADLSFSERSSFALERLDTLTASSSGRQHASGDAGLFVGFGGGAGGPLTAAHDSGLAPTICLWDSRLVSFDVSRLLAEAHRGRHQPQTLSAQQPQLSHQELLGAHQHLPRLQMHLGGADGVTPRLQLHAPLTPPELWAPHVLPGGCGCGVSTASSLTTAGKGAQRGWLRYELGARRGVGGDCRLWLAGSLMPGGCRVGWAHSWGRGKWRATVSSSCSWA